MDQVMGTASGAVTAPVQAGRLPSLTGLRWFAAFGVFGFHMLHSPELSADPGMRAVLTVAFQSGAAGVTFFFVLSGLVLTWAARPEDRAVAFWRRRVARVVPNHVVVWVGVLAMLVLIHRPAPPGPAVT